MPVLTNNRDDFYKHMSESCNCYKEDNCEELIKSKTERDVL